MRIPQMCTRDRERREPSFQWAFGGGRGERNFLLVRNGRECVRTTSSRNRCVSRRASYVYWDLAGYQSCSLSLLWASSWEVVEDTNKREEAKASLGSSIRPPRCQTNALTARSLDSDFQLPWAARVLFGGSITLVLSLSLSLSLSRFLLLDFPAQSLQFSACCCEVWEPVSLFWPGGARALEGKLADGGGHHHAHVGIPDSFFLYFIVPGTGGPGHQS